MCFREYVCAQVSFRLRSIHTLIAGEWDAIIKVQREVTIQVVLLYFELYHTHRYLSIVWNTKMYDIAKLFRN